MLLYVCRECGTSQNVSFTQALSKVFQTANRAFAKGLAESCGLRMEEPEEKPAGWPCPVNAEHGMMQAVTSEDRLIIKPAIVEAEQGENTPEPDEGAKQQRLLQ